MTERAIYGGWKSLRTRLILLALISLVPLISLAVYHAVEARQDALAQGRATVQHLAQLAELNVALPILGTRYLVHALAQSPALRGDDPAACAAALAAQVKQGRRYTGFIVASRDGKLLCSADPATAPTDISDRDYFRRAIETRQAAVGKPLRGWVSRQPVLPIAQPLLGAHGEVERVLVAGLDLSWIGTAISGSPPVPGLIITMWDAEGRVLYRRPDDGHWSGRLDPGAPITQAVRTGRAGEAFEAIDLDGIDRVYALAHSREHAERSLVIGVGVARDELTGDADRMLAVELLVLAAVAGLVLFTVISVAEKFVRNPVAALARAADRLAEGDLSVRVPEAEYRGELGALSVAFNRMAARLQETLASRADLEREVAQRKRAEDEITWLNEVLEQRVRERTEKLRESEARFRSLTELWADVYWETDARFRFTSFAGAGATRFEPAWFDDLIGKARWEIGYINMSEADWARHIAQLEAHEPFRDLELCRYNKAGARVWVSVSGEPMFDAAGRFKGYRGVGRNITERKQAEVAQGRLAAIVEDSEDAIISRDLEQRVVSWNAAAERLFGYAAQEVIGRRIDFFIPPDQQAQVDKMRALLDEGEHVPPYETVRLAKDGRRIDVLHTLSPIRDARGQVIGASLTIRDITERKQLEQQLRQSQKMEAMGQLTGGIAHDFNNLLGVIIGNLDLLERSLSGDQTALKRVATAQKSAMRGADLTQRLLAFSRRQPLKAAPLGLAACVANVIEMARRTIGPDIEIKTVIAPELPAVLADAAGLESALLNLMINSRDAMPRGGVISVAARVLALDERFPAVRTGELPAGRYMRLAVSDTGKGMTQEVLARVFEPFFTTKERGKGTGLGLAMVYGFAKQSGGHVGLYSEPGRGTTVTLYLPLADPDAAAADEAPQAESEHERIDATVLVVDDEAGLLEVAAAYLEEMGFRVLQAADGPQALNLLAGEHSVELLLTDIMMPGGMNGVELVRRARAVRPGLRVLYSTGFASSGIAERNAAALDVPVLHKPYRRAEFVAAVRKAMANGK